MDDNLRGWLALTRIDGLGARGAHSLVRQLGSPQAVYASTQAELEGCGLPRRVVESISSGSSLEAAEKEIEAAARLGCRMVAFPDERYPALLKQIADPPLVLYVQGDESALGRHAVAMVGTRRPTAYGMSVAHRLASDLAERQLVIVSGLARGIDSAAHRGALEAGGKTIAVLGSGLDIVYPRENGRLAERVRGQGALISEFPLGTAPVPENFPIRNRVISGLALGAIIVEAAEYSGSLITARLALEQNREVFAVPGNITAAQSFGPNLLIKQGAKLVDQWLDVFEEFPPSIRAELVPVLERPGADNRQEQGAPLFASALTPDQKAILETLKPDEALFVDSICGSTSLSQPRVLSALLSLEMSGLIRQLPGMNFIRKL